MRRNGGSGILAVACACLLLVGCAVEKDYAVTSFEGAMPRFGTIERSDTKQINDEEIRNAFEARPQMALPASVAVYEHTYKDWRYHPRDNENIDTILEGLKDNQHFSKVTVLSSPFIQGSVTPRSTRLAAAYHKADLTLLFDSDFSVKVSPTLLCLLDLTIIGAALVPSTRVTVESRVSAWLMDTRNGHIYTSACEQESKSRFIPSGRGKETVRELRKELTENNYKETLGRILADMKNTLTRQTSGR